MIGPVRFQAWFSDFARDYPRIRLDRRRNELRARHEEGPDEYLSGKPVSLPLPRFRVWVGGSAAETAKPRRAHRRTNKPPSGRPAYEWDVYLAPKVFEVMWDEWVSETEAISVIMEFLGQFDCWNNPKHPDYDARRAARKSARERVYQSLKRYRQFDHPNQEIVRFRDANDGWTITPEEAGRRTREGMRDRRQGLFSP
jgi:hypothetical protein